MLSLNKISERVKRLLYHAEDYLFEKMNSLEFGGVIHKDILFTDESHSSKFSTSYQAVWCRNLRAIFSVIKHKNFIFNNFIDIGSGKGKACLYSYRRSNFNKIIGIELSSKLHEIAVQNKKRLRADNVEFIVKDALEYKLPNETNLVFMFNPFGPEVLMQFLKNNLDHFQEFNSCLA